MTKSRNPGSTPVKVAVNTDSRLLALDNEINRLVLKIEVLEARKRRADDANERARIAREIRTHQKKITKLYATFSRTEPVSLVGAAALLRRVPAMLGGDAADDGPLAIAGRLVDSALVVVEKNAE